MPFGFVPGFFYPHTFTLIRSSDGATVCNVRGQKSSEHDVIIPDITLGIARAICLSSICPAAGSSG